MKNNKAKTLALTISLSLSLPGFAPAEDNTEEKPSMEFLEFLGNWQDKDGSWIDPMNFATRVESNDEDPKIKDQQHD